MNIEGMILHETARRETYKALAECYYLPDGHLAAHIKALERQLTVLGSIGLPHAVLLRSEFEGLGNLKTLQIEFARLFVGPYSLPAPPYGSVYLEEERKIMGDSTIDAKERYKMDDLVISESFKDAPDHIAAELEFMYFLIFNEIEAIHTVAPEAVCSYLLKQKSFLQGHLGAWVTDFTFRVEHHSKADFYRNLAAATREFIAEDKDNIINLDIPTPVCQASRHGQTRLQFFEILQKKRSIDIGNLLKN